MKSCMKKWSPVTHPLLESPFIDDSKPYYAESPPLDNKWDKSRTRPHHTNKVRNINKCMAEMQGQGRIQI